MRRDAEVRRDGGYLGWDRREEGLREEAHRVWWV